MRTSLNEEMKLYLHEVSKKKVLSRSEEVALFERLRSGDESARHEIVEANLRFVIKIALGFVGRGVALPDLIQEGNIGLLEVVDKFDHRRGFRFSTYAAFWIRQSIQLALRKQCNVIRLPVRKSRFLGQLNETISNFAQNHGRMPTAYELATIVNMPEDQLENLLQLRDSVLSLDSEPDEEGNAILHQIRDDCTPSPLENCMESETRRRVENALGTLDDREQKVLKLRYGFHSGKNLSLRTTSRIVGMSQEGVRRVERKALHKLRRPNSRAMVTGLL